MNIQHPTLNIERRIKTEFIRSWKFEVQIIKVAALWPPDLLENYLVDMIFQIRGKDFLDEGEN